MIICCCGNETWDVENYQVIQSYEETFHEYGTYAEWQEHTRVCDYCGAAFNQGYVAGHGECYACEECFPHVMEGMDLQEAPEDDESGACYLYMAKDGIIKDSGWYWTEWV